MPDPRETGWGAPDDLAGSGFDVGWGSPDDLAPPGADTGWGSPSYITGAALSASVCADDGGEILTITGDFSTATGPFTVTLYGGPDAADHPCYGLQFGEGYVCRPNEARTSLEFVTPPLQVGTYSLRLAGDGGTQEFPNAIVVVRRMWLSGIYDMRKRFPRDVYPTGPQDAEDEPLLDAYGPAATITAKFRAETVKAIGEELTQLGGVRTTRLTATLAPTATTANVESTYQMPEAGIVYVAGLDTPGITYTGKTATTLTGLTRSAYETQTGDIGATVVDWNREASYYEQARADLLVGEATGARLTEMGVDWYGVPRGGSWMTDDTYRTLVETVASLDRINWYAIFRVVDAWTAQFRDPQTSSVSGAAVADPTGLYFRDDHYGRWLRVTDTDGTQRLHRIRAVLPGVGVVLHAGKGPYWVGAAYATGARTWEILPFWLERVLGEVQVFVALPYEYAAVPHYIQDLADAAYAAVTPPDMTGLEDPIATAGGDESGFVLDDADTASSSVSPEFPFYIGGGGLENLQIILDDIVAEGIVITAETVPA